MTTQDSATNAWNEPIVHNKALLDQETDAKLRSLAHTLGVSNGDLIRYFINIALKDVKNENGPIGYNPVVLERLRAELSGTSN
jgi:hypothetical protein